jgi:predicted HTH transcriptional regulator
VQVNLHTGLERTETRLFDLECFDEAWTNACLHNRWIRNVPPTVYVFSDRIEITSIGGLPLDFSKEEFFAGISRPINLPLQKIMGQLGMVEQTGHGVPKIVGVYGREAFELAENHITVKLPFAFEPTMAQTSFDGLSKSAATVLRVVLEHPLYKMEEIAAEVGLGRSRVAQILAELKELGRLERLGGKKGGYWKVK